MDSSYQLASMLKEVDQYRLLESRPRIGISANRKDGQICLAETYVQSVIQAGGAPVVIPATTDLCVLSTVIQELDGILMSGGGDINPLFLNEEPIPALQDVDTLRDRYDLLLIRLASNRQIPMMGICRGHQMLNAAFGGTLYQDIYAQGGKPAIRHSQKMAREEPSHTVRLEDGCVIAVNSFHHQAVRGLAPEFVQTAVAPDGINEGMRHLEKSIFSVQWHPEAMAVHGDEEAQALFNRFVEEARIFRQVKEMHKRIITLDSHADTPMLFPGRFNIGVKQGGKVNLPLLEEGRIDAVFMVAYIPQGARDDASLAKATAYAEERLREVIRQEQLNPERMGIARTPDDLFLLKQAGKKAIFLGIENGYALGKDLENIRRFRDMGVSYITLCHNGDNDLCDSARGNGEWKGLSPLGRQAVAEMNRSGVMVDVSHAAESTFYDVLECSRYPVVATHSSARALCDHPRNLTDDQLKAMAEQGGVVQVCLYKGFINQEAEKASLGDAIRHINHIVDLVGVDHVGIGSDFDGDGELIGCRASNELINLTTHLLKEGYSEADIKRIWGGNFLRVMRKVQSARQ